MNRRNPDSAQLPTRINRRVVLGSALAGCASLVGLANDSHAAAATASGVLYVGTNDPRTGMNAVLGFRRGPNGLTPLPGSPFRTRGTGQGNPGDVVGAPLDSDQEIVISTDKRFLFAVNSGSNTIAVFHIIRDGRLVHVGGSPFPSGGINPQSVGFANDRLYVINKNEDAAQLPNGALPNITAFRVSRAGRLTPIPNSTRTFPVDSAPTQALTSPNGRFVFVPELAFAITPINGGAGGVDVALGNPVLDSFRVNFNGSLTPAPGSPLTIPPFAVPAGSQLPFFPADTRVPLGLTHHPTAPVVYSGVVSSGSVAAFSVDQTTGQLTFANAAILSGGVAPCWLTTNQAGTRLYVANTLSTMVSVLDISNPLAPAEIQSVAPGSGPANLVNIALDPTGQFLYVLSQRTGGFPVPGAANAINTFRVEANGTLTPLANSPLLLNLGATAIKGLAVL